MGRGQNNRGGGTVGSHTLRGIHLNDALTEGANDAPAAQVGSQGDSERAGGLDPQGDGVVAIERTRSHQSQENHAHGLLRIVRTVRQRHQGCGSHLTLAEAAVLALIGHRGSNAVHQPGAGCRHNRGNDGG